MSTSKRFTRRHFLKSGSGLAASAPFLAYWNNRRLKSDPDKEVFLGDNEANSWLNPLKRAPWHV